MRITVLDSATLGYDLDLAPLFEVGEVEIYENTAPCEIPERIAASEVLIVNKIKLGEAQLDGASALKLICVAATGYDNIDIAYCKKKGIAVCNVIGYSSNSVAQVTVATVLSLACHLQEHGGMVRSGRYTESGVANSLVPVYHELAGQTWGIVGYGNIGKQVARVAEAFGCRVLYSRLLSDGNKNCVSVEALCRESDIITIHTPLTPETRGLINKRVISMMKKNAIVVNAARGAVTDEAALAEAVQKGEIGALGSDVYATEPFPQEHPFYAIKDLPNVLFTPHMAWGAYEARVRCLDEMIMNIRAFYEGRIRCRVDVD